MTEACACACAWNPRDVIVGGLALSLAASYAATSLLPFVLKKAPTEARSANLRMIAVAIITLVAGYILGNGGLP